MILNIKETDRYNNLHGDEGEVTINRLHDKGVTEGLDLFAVVTVPVSAGIGYHRHQSDSEGYYIISVNVECKDADCEVKAVGAGELYLITKGQSHGIRNTGDTELKFLAVVF